VKEMSIVRLADFQSNPNSNKFYTDEYQFIAKNGSTVWVESTYRFIVSEDSGKPEIVGVSRDITEKKLDEKVIYQNIFKKKSSTPAYPLIQPFPNMFIQGERFIPFSILFQIV
jgi:hypothetical protein